MTLRLKQAKRQSVTSRRPSSRDTPAAHRERHAARRDGNRRKAEFSTPRTPRFVRHGTAGARMQDIAKEAGVNQALLHYLLPPPRTVLPKRFSSGRQVSSFLKSFQVMASDAALEEKVAKVGGYRIDHLARTSELPATSSANWHHHPERARQLIAALTGATPEDVRPRVLLKLGQQIDAGVRTGRLRPIAPEQFLVNLLSLCVFPFAARPMLMVLLGLDRKQFDRFIQERRDQLADFFLRALGA